MRQNGMAVAYIHLEHRVGQGLNDRALELDNIVFCQAIYLPNLSAGLTVYLIKTSVPQCTVPSSHLVRSTGSPVVIKTLCS